MRHHAERTKLTGSLGLSAVLHLSVAALVIWQFRPSPPIKLPPIYKVNIVAAPPGPRAIGEVKPSELIKTPPKPVDAPQKMREVAPKELAVPIKKASTKPVKKATPTPAKAKPAPKSEAPKAGGGPKGGTGSDVATVKVNGIDFPYQGYLNNIVRQIALHFKPDNPNAPLHATVTFLIHRDGSVSELRFITGSGVYTFDIAVRGAVEKASKSFGPLPDGFKDDVLPVIFNFDPRLLQ
jgi:protein TonB